MARIKFSRRRLRGDEFFDAAGVPRTLVEYRPSSTVFVQGAPAASVMFLRKGRVKLSVLSRGGKEAVVGLLRSGDFFGEGSLAGQPTRIATATALTAATVVVVKKADMAARLHARPELADR